MSIENLLKEERFDYLKLEDKQFVVAITNELDRIGYTFGDKIGDGICWGKYMMIFTKKNVKGKKVYARIYFKEDSVTLRYFLSDVSKHGAYIRDVADFIREAFTGTHGACGHCRGDVCRFRKCYSIDDVEYEKCNGVTFEFFNPKVERVGDYMKLFCEFYPSKAVK